MDESGETEAKDKQLVLVSLYRGRSVLPKLHVRHHCLPLVLPGRGFPKRLAHRLLIEAQFQGETLQSDPQFCSPNPVLNTGMPKWVVGGW